MLAAFFVAFKSVTPVLSRTIHQRYDFLLANATSDMVSDTRVECLDDELILYRHLEVRAGRSIGRKLRLRDAIDTVAVLHHVRTEG